MVVINAKEAALTGNKMKTKLYRWHTGWMGGLKELTARQVHERAPERIIEHAVKGMLPPNKLRPFLMKRLRIFPAASHSHSLQTEQSKAYAPEYGKMFAIESNQPRAKADTGVLVRDTFPGVFDPKKRAELAKTLAGTEESNEVALKKLEAELEARRARKAAEVQGAKQLK